MGHLIVFSHLRWDFVYQRPQHLLSRLARWYHILFVEEPMFQEGPAHLERSTPLVNVDVLRPGTPLNQAGFHDAQLPILGRLVLEYLAAENIDDYAVWFYTPLPVPLLTALRPRAVIYDCMDELSAFKDAPWQTREREIALLAAAQLVLTGGPSLYEAKRLQHPNVLCLPSAVDARHFSPEHARSDAAGMQRAHELQGTIEQPRLGFFGVIDERLDTRLVAELADADPAWHIIMVGPVVKIRLDELPQRPNLHWLGKQPYELLPQLVAGWDVCLLPFALNESTRFISPTKTLEYMAAEEARGQHGGARCRLAVRRCGSDRRELPVLCSRLQSGASGDRRATRRTFAQHVGARCALLVGRNGRRDPPRDRRRAEPHAVQGWLGSVASGAVV